MRTTQTFLTDWLFCFGVTANGSNGVTDTVVWQFDGEK